MRDREFVNRFCACQILDLEDYRDMDDFLAEGLKKMNAEPESLVALSSQFRQSLENNFRLFGKQAFRKHKPDQDSRGVINASLWDVMSTGLSRYETYVVDEHSDALKTAFYRLISDDDFQHATTYGPNGPKQVRYRFSVMRKTLKEVLGADPT